MTDFIKLIILMRENDIPPISNKLMVLLISLLLPVNLSNCTWSWLLLAYLLPVKYVFLGAENFAFLLQAGPIDDVLGYSVIALRTGM